jgi:hypothetical protein
MPGGGGRNTLELVLGGLAGAMAAKTVSNMSFITSINSSPIVRAVAAAATGYIGGMAVEKFVKMRSLAEGFALGGFLEGGAIVVSTYLPSVGGQLGLGAIIPGYVNPPVNPVTYRPPVQMIPAKAGMSGLRGIHAAFGGAL